MNTAGEPLVRADAVTRRFGDFTAVQGVSMHVAPGEVVGLLGSNGAGKTTLIRMLLGILAASDGQVTLLDGRPNRQRRSRLGYVPQNLGLYRDLTVAENFDFIASAYRVAAPPIPDELARYRDTLVDAIPLGAQRQAAFAAALAHRPDLLLLDEPTSGVAALSRARLWDTIRDQSDDGVGVLVSTHYMQEAQECDRLLLMSHGRLVADGTEADIIGGTTAVVVHTNNWADAFAALNRAGAAVILDGRTVRVANTTPDAVSQILDAAHINCHVEPAPATIEERMLVLART